MSPPPFGKEVRGCYYSCGFLCTKAGQWKIILQTLYEVNILDAPKIFQKPYGEVKEGQEKCLNTCKVTQPKEGRADIALILCSTLTWHINEACKRETAGVYCPTEDVVMLCSAISEQNLIGRRTVIELNYLRNQTAEQNSQKLLISV